MNIELSKKEFRRLLDLAYIGNWVLNSERDGSDRIADYDALTSKLFALCGDFGMDRLFEVQRGITIPSREYVDGGIHDAIMYYEDSAFFEILAEELTRRDMGFPTIGEDNADEFASRMDKYIDEFEENGIENIQISSNSGDFR
ncbi:MAG: hypothetical protein LBC65_06420 [Oscillospiraceae bacterium]|jgi:hypothetical protein|nr:hypothetical protein [Oscillospiraceae bacterium]